MITLRKAGTRGHALHGWLESWHSFSFADYHDPAHVRFGALRVINKDIVQPGAGFDTHGHRDSMNNGEDIHSGEIQLMRAGSGAAGWRGDAGLFHRRRTQNLSACRARQPTSQWL